MYTTKRRWTGFYFIFPPGFCHLILGPPHHPFDQPVHVGPGVSCVKAHPYAILSLRYRWPCNGARVHPQIKEMRRQWSRAGRYYWDDGRREGRLLALEVQRQRKHVYWDLAEVGAQAFHKVEGEVKDLLRELCRGQ
jgi:hypothetical protein